MRAESGRGRAARKVGGGVNDGLDVASPSLSPPLHFSRHFLLLLLAERMNLPIHNAPTFSFAFFSRQPLSYLEQSQKKEPSSSAIPFFPESPGASHQTEWPSSRRTAAGLRAGGGEKGSQMARPHVIPLPTSGKGHQTHLSPLSPCVTPQQKTNVGGISLSLSPSIRAYTVEGHIIAHVFRGRGRRGKE